MKRYSWTACALLLVAQAVRAGEVSLDSVVQSLADNNPAVKTTLADLGKHYKKSAEVPAILKDLKDEDKANLATFIGRELVRMNLHDEALAVLSTVASDKSVDPACHVFNLSICQFQLHDRDQALKSINQLLGMTTPERYRSLGMAMKSVLEGLKAEKLDGIAHDMRDLRRRLNNEHTDRKVVEIETSVIARLDKIIEELEKEQDSCSGCGGGGGGSGKKPGPGGPSGSGGKPSGANPNGTPASESGAPDAKADGIVEGKNPNGKDAWGMLNPKDREKAENGINERFPAHYRDAIREYMRRLAREN